jgi:hypothetical protein
MELNQVLKRVRQFIEKAEADIAPGATPEQRAAALIEQQSARNMADKLMTDYAVTAAMANASGPAAARPVPGKMLIPNGKYSDIQGHVYRLLLDVAEHCRCKVRYYGEYNKEEGQYYSKIYGWESDLRYFEILFTTLQLHMLGALLPNIREDESIEEASYRLHNIGYNWLEIAKLYGWNQINDYDLEEWEKHPTYLNKHTQEREHYRVAVMQYEKAYKRALRIRGESPIKVPPGGSATFRNSAADGYVARIWRRLRDVEQGRVTESGASIVLRGAADELFDFFRKENPDLFRPAAEAVPCPKCAKSKSGHCRDHPMGSFRPRPYSSAGYAVGVNRANTASLNPAPSTPKTRQISLWSK